MQFSILLILSNVLLCHVSSENSAIITSSTPPLLNSDTNTSSGESGSAYSSRISPPLQADVVSAQGHIIAQDVTGVIKPPAANSKTSSAEPSLGLHGITEQQLNLRYYNFICSSHFHLDCKLTETLQICMKDRYFAVLGLPLAFESGSSDLTFLTKWMRQCDQNDQEKNSEAMRIIRKRIHLQNQNNWEGVFKSAEIVSLTSGLLIVILNYQFL